MTNNLLGTSYDNKLENIYTSMIKQTNRIENKS